MAARLRREYDVQTRIRDILVEFVNQKFNDVTITGVETEYEVYGRRADIAVLKDDGNPVLIIETKKKYEWRGFRVETRFIPTSEHVVGQAVAYAAILKRMKGVHVPFVATASERQLALYRIPENIEELVNWRAVEERDYSRVLRNFYEFERENRVFHKSHRLSKEFFKELLDLLTGIYRRKYAFKDKRQQLHWELLEDLRSFVDLITPFIQDAIAPNNKFRDDIAEKLEEYSGKTGYMPTPEGLAREMAYVLLNKIVFYKVLERYYKLPQLTPLYERGEVKTCNEYLNKLNNFFEKAVELTQDFELIFKTGVYDLVDVVESEEVRAGIDWLIRHIDHYQIEKLGDIVGFMYEELIPGEERHQLGQFYTPKPIAELIVKWCVRSPNDKILDPGCGSGTFLVEAYKRLAELKLKKPYSEIKHVPGDVHRDILKQLYGIDINEFPVQLTIMNLAMKNVRTPSTEIYILTNDYFNIIPNQRILFPFKVKTLRGEKQVEVVFKDFDAAVGNPPYTRWTDIPEKTKERIRRLYERVLREYGLYRFVTGGAIPGIYIPWIIHSTHFLKAGGRLGMIISDSWLQTEYGIGFLRYLTDNFNVEAVIDILPRVFEKPLIGTCIILLEKRPESEVRDSNTTVFMYVTAEKSLHVDTILRVIEETKRRSEEVKGEVTVKGEGYIVNTVKQSKLKHIRFKPIALFFGADKIINKIEESGEVVKLGTLFQPSEGNTIWSIYASMRLKGAGVGGEEFYYLDEDKVRQYGLSKYIGTYLKPLISTPERLKYFTFTESDWSQEKEYMFIAHAPRTRLPPEVQEYIKLGETSIKLKKGERKPVSESKVAKTRKDLGKVEVLGQSIQFYDWYDLGGVVEAPIYAVRGAQYWVRFVLARFQCALDDRVLALIPKRGVQLDEVELKALLAYLNSSFTQLQAEVRGRSTGGGMLELDVKPLSELPILDVKRLPREGLEKLSQLFDKLEAGARRLGGADEVENVFGSELARELTGRGDVKEGVVGLFNTVVKEIDQEIAKLLGVEHLVETIRSLVLEMARRRLSRAEEARREAIRGSEELPKLEKPKARRRGGKEVGAIRRLDEFLGKT